MKIKLKYLIALLLFLVSSACFANFEFSVINASKGHHLKLTVLEAARGNLYWNGVEIPRYIEIAIPELPGHTGFLFEATHSGGVDIVMLLSGDELGQKCTLSIEKGPFDISADYYHRTPCYGFVFGQNHTVYYVGMT